MRKKLLAIVLLGLAACERRATQKPETPSAPTPASLPSPTPATTPEESQTDQTEEAPSPSPVREQEASFDVEAPSEVNMDAGNSENRLVKSEVLARIDLMPRLTPEEKDKLYVQVERARGMGKIVTIPFATGKVTVGTPEVASLEEKLKLPQLQKFAEDPTVVFVVLGFADKKGDEKKNLSISLQRADSVVRTLKERCSIMNVIHAVGMGSSDMFDAKDLDKNRVVEVWAVLP
ncbi:MAG TPA: OmpA family protein [Terrimicrobiaceae bacterium]|jgi:outer membrane protein OmpA-like peptidoglycan-associated protein|nr:OmpA family protein [Terrimicrobiaceae bacterium]